MTASRDDVRRAVLEATQAAYRAGLCVLPVAEDGTKKPDCTSWDQWKRERPSPEEMGAWFGAATRMGFGLLCGRVSGGLECFEFDDRPTYDSFLDFARQTGLRDLVDRIERGYVEDTPNGGAHWLYYCAAVTGSTKLARRPRGDDERRDEDDGVQVLIETRGEGGFVIVAPSNGKVHPSGRAYQLRSGSFESIATITPDERESLFELARTFDEMPRPEARPAVPKNCVSGDRPGDHFNRDAKWNDVLTPHGWTLVCERGGEQYWRRPGKAFGISATTNFAGSDLLKVFSTSTPFDAEHTYSKFAAYVVLGHGGDFHAAAKELAAKDGWRLQTAPTANVAPTAQTAATASAVQQIGPRVVCLADVEPELVEWIWPGRLARGKLALWIGDPGVGKSYLTLDAAARLSRGLSWPDGAPGVLASTVLLSAEDGLADTIRPRLDGLKADVTRIHSLEAVRDASGERGFSLDTDLPHLETVIKQTQATLVVIDPLSAYFGKGDSYKDTDVRRALAPVAKLAERIGAAILGVVHLTKATDRKVIYRALGGIGFVAAARLVLGVAKDPENEERRLFFPVKSNLCRPAPVLAYRFVGERHVWDQNPVPGVNADQLLGASATGSDTEERHEAAAFIRGILAEGPRLADEVFKEGRANGFSKRTLNRAKRKAGVDSGRLGFGPDAKWHWSVRSKGAEPTSEGAKSATKDAKIGPIECHGEHGILWWRGPKTWPD